MKSLAYVYTQVDNAAFITCDILKQNKSIVYVNWELAF